MKVTDLKQGSVLSEMAFYVFESYDRSTGLATLKNDDGQKIQIGSDYVEQLLESADYFEKEEELSQTDLIIKFAESRRTAMTANFIKKGAEKAPTKFKKEVKDAVEKVKNAKVSEVEKILTEYLTNPIEKFVPGEERTARGRHYGVPNEHGRYPFIDMGKDRGTNPAHDGRTIQVDPRTLQWIIVDKVKYKLKKK